MKMIRGVCKQVVLLAVVVSGLAATPAQAGTAAAGVLPTVAAGTCHSLAVKADGALWAWGCNHEGQLGDGTRTARSAPVLVMRDVVTVAAGDDSSYAVRSDGSLWAWGWNGFGQLGDGSWMSQSKPVFVMNDVAMVAAGAWHALAVGNDGSLWAWGANGGQLGDGTVTHRRHPYEIASSGFVWADGGAFHSLFVKEDGTVWASGDNDVGQLGVGDYDNRLSMVKTVGLAGVAVVSATHGHSMALTAGGEVYAWGDNFMGQVGVPGPENYAAPVKVPLVGVYSTIAAGGGSSFALSTGKELFGWGWNEDGQLGDGTNWDQYSPVKVGSDVETVATAIDGFGYTFTVKTDGLLRAVGDNWFGQLGDGTRTSRRTPVIVMQMGPGAVTGVKAPVAKMYLVAGKSKVLPAVVYPYDALLKDVTWKSANTSVAKVNAAGKVTAGAKAGGKSTTITATSVDGKFVAKTTVYVVKKAVKLKSVKVPASGTTGVVVGGTMSVKASWSPAKATGVVPVFASSDVGVAVVDAAGVVTGLSAGKATISVKAGGKTKKFVLTVGLVAPTKITLNAAKATVARGKKVALEVVEWTPSDADPQTVVWKTSNKKIATVNSEGVVTGKKKGKVTISAVTWNGKSVKCVVTVK